MNAMEHDCDEARKDNSFELTGWPYGCPIDDPLSKARVAFAKTTSPAKEVINKPPHYTQGEIECIDAIKSMLTVEEFRGYCKGQAVAYIWREKYKGGDTDIGKAGWYCHRLAP
jgi:hypothetical protein